MATANNSQYLTRGKNVDIAYGEWLESLSDAQYLAELDKVRNYGRYGNKPPTE